MNKNKNLGIVSLFASAVSASRISNEDLREMVDREGKKVVEELMEVLKRHLMSNKKELEH
jgi:ATP-dependent Zn protease